MNFLLRWSLSKLQRLCPHKSLKADLLEGDTHRRAMWCETCGAINTTHGTSGLRLPQPLWEE